MTTTPDYHTNNGAAKVTTDPAPTDSPADPLTQMSNYSSTIEGVRPYPFDLHAHVFRDGQSYTRPTIQRIFAPDKGVHRIDMLPGAANPQGLPVTLIAAFDTFEPTLDLPAWWIVRAQLTIDGIALPGIKTTVMHSAQEWEHPELSGVMHYVPVADYGNNFSGWWTITVGAVGINV